MAEQRSYTGSFTNRWKFTGKELDEETGLYYFGARFYNPVTSLWLSVDPLAEKYPAYSPYNYCINNPINVIDPDGRDIIILDGKKQYKYVDGKVFMYNQKTGNYASKAISKMSRNLKTIVGDLNKIRNNSAGKTELIDYFQQTGNDIKISKGVKSIEGYEDYYDPTTNSANYAGKDYYNAGGLPTNGPDNISTTPAYIVLGHEMAHKKFNDLYPDLSGLNWTFNNETTAGIPLSELFTTHIENKMRAADGLFLRTQYSKSSKSKLLNGNESLFIPKNEIMHSPDIRDGVPKGGGFIYTTFENKRNNDLKN